MDIRLDFNRTENGQSVEWVKNNAPSEVWDALCSLNRFDGAGNFYGLLVYPDMISALFEFRTIGGELCNYRDSGLYESIRVKENMTSDERMVYKDEMNDFEKSKTDFRELTTRYFEACDRHMNEIEMLFCKNGSKEPEEGDGYGI